VSSPFTTNFPGFRIFFSQVAVCACSMGFFAPAYTEIEIVILMNFDNRIGAWDVRDLMNIPRCSCQIHQVRESKSVFQEVMFS
jgi:hypothetical protein